MSTITYQVKVRDTSGNPVAFFAGAGRGEHGGGLQSLSYNKRLCTSGGWEVRIHGDDERVELLRLQEVLPKRVDYIFEFLRRDPGYLDWYTDFAGFHRSDEFTEDQEGHQIYIARGVGFNDQLAGEAIRYYAGSEEASKSGAAETVAKEFVDENIGPNAGVDDNGDSRVRAGLTVEVNAGTGLTWTGARANKNLLDVLVEIAKFATADFNVVQTGDATFEFQWRDGQWGDDKTRGNVPAVIFGSQYNNATNIRLSYSRSDEVNVVYVGGQGVGAARNYVTQSTTAINDSPWSRRAVFRDAKNTPTVAGLEDTGDEILEKQKSVVAISFDIKQTTATRYGVHWDYGDLVTVEFRGQDFDKKIVGVTVTLSSDGKETIKPEVENA